MRDQLLAGSRLFVDETRAPVLEPGRGRTKTGYFWTIARDDRPWNGTRFRPPWSTPMPPAAAPTMRSVC